MNRTLRECLLDDWTARLTAGAARTPLTSPDGARWLQRFAGVCLIVAVSLYLGCGYHAGFARLNAWTAVSYPDWLWAWLTVLGDERTPFALALLFSLWFPRVFWSLTLAGALAALYAHGLKELCDAARPPATLAADAFHLIGPGHRHASFPSGHSVTAGVFFGVLIYHARLIEWRILFLLCAILAGISRVAVGVHWPIDVAAGLMGGALAAGLGVRLAARWSAPATNVRVHLTLTMLAVGVTLRLLSDDGGYPDAAYLLQTLGIVALTNAFVQYLALALFRCWRRV